MMVCFSILQKMALRNILTDKDDSLHKVCKPVDKFDEKLGVLLDDMHETLDKAQGLGLAAPQIGLCRRKERIGKTISKHCRTMG